MHKYAPFKFTRIYVYLELVVFPMQIVQSLKTNTLFKIEPSENRKHSRVEIWSAFVFQTGGPVFWEISIRVMFYILCV